MGYEGEAVRVLQVHAYVEDAEASPFLSIEFENGAVVDLCGMHRIANIRAKHVRAGDILNGQTVKAVSSFVGVVRSYDLLTEDAGYRISGLPVNSMIEEMYEAGQTGMRSFQDEAPVRCGAVPQRERE